jgi:large subunit ribosomal protein L4
MKTEVSLPLLKASGDVGSRPVDAGRFKRRGRRVLLKEYVLMTEARRRTGTHSARGRSEVSGSTKKMYRQKGTGNARHGSYKAPQLRGGGVAFAKKPRSYGWAMPKKARRAALESALRAKLEAGAVRVVERFPMQAPRTKDFVDLLGRLKIEGSFLVVPAVHREAVWKSCRNIPGCSYLEVRNLNAYEVLRRHTLLLEEEALKVLENRIPHA